MQAYALSAAMTFSATFSELMGFCMAKEGVSLSHTGMHADRGATASHIAGFSAAHHTCHSLVQMFVTTTFNKRSPAPFHARRNHSACDGTVRATQHHATALDP